MNKIKTYQFSEGYQVSICPERGGIITSLVLNGKEILYMDNETFENSSTNVRGGIPILFPNAGPIDSDRYPQLPQHGFARNASTWKGEITPRDFVETLSINSHTSYPHDCTLTITGTFNENNSFTLDQSVQNLSDTSALPIAMGLHPYFRVANNEKKNIAFNFDGREYVQGSIDQWANGHRVSIDNPKVKDPNAKIKVFIPQLGTLIIDTSIEYQKIWIWSQPGKDFICIEPVMRDEGGLAMDPEMLAPNDSFHASVTFDVLQ